MFYKFVATGNLLVNLLGFLGNYNACSGIFAT